jgi:hypothetical protein
MRRVLGWAAAVIVPVALLRLLHLTWVIVAVTVALLIVAGLLAGRRRPKKS